MNPRTCTRTMIDALLWLDDQGGDMDSAAWRASAIEATRDALRQRGYVSRLTRVVDGKRVSVYALTVSGEGYVAGVRDARKEITP